jgi:thioredoxin-related protein
MSPVSFQIPAPLWRMASVLLLSLRLLALAPDAAAATPQLPGITSLPQELRHSAAIGQPLLVMVSLEQCPHCVIVRQHHLLPLLKQGVLVRQVNMRDQRPLLALDGSSLTQDELVRRWKVKVVPTLLFLGPDGRELAERLEGASLPDFYGAYLEDRLQRARQALPGR